MLIPETDVSAERFKTSLAAQDRLFERVVRASNPRTKAASVLGADNLATEPFEVEQFLVYCLMQAADMGKTINNACWSLDGRLALPIMGIFPLIRTQIEASSMALWVMSPTERKTRVLRRLQAGHKELSYEKQLLASVANAMSPSEAAAARRKQTARQRRHKKLMAGIASGNGIESEAYMDTLPGWEALVRAAGEAAGVRDDWVVSGWRLASGFTHPSMQRGTGFLSFTDTTCNGKIMSGTLSADSPTLVAVMDLSEQLTSITIDRYRDTKLRINGERPSPVRTW